VSNGGGKCGKHSDSSKGSISCKVAFSGVAEGVLCPRQSMTKQMGENYRVT